MFIDRQMAQKIVDRAMKITGANVNVMDQQGVIIGSGDPARLGHLHEGALQVLRSRADVDIERDEEGALQGVKGGVNRPVRHQGEIVGVVGITGEPEAVRQYADLVVMTAELIVEQAGLTAQVQWDSRQRESVLLRLLEGGPSDSLLEDRIARLQLDLSRPQVVVVLELGTDGEALSLARIQEIQAALAHADPEMLQAMTSARHLALLRPVTLRDGDWDRAMLSRQLDDLLKPLERFAPLAYRAGVGDYFPSADGLPSSYRCALRTLAVCRGRKSRNRLQFAADHALDLLLDEARDSWAGQRLLADWQAFLARDRQGTLVKTLECYLSENMDLRRTAERLHIHRNTLRYRLDRIGEVLNVDLGNLEQLLRLALTLRLHRLQRAD